MFLPSHLYGIITGYVISLSQILFHMQAANYEAEASGIHDGEYQLTKHEFSSLGPGKYSGKHFMLPIHFLILSFIFYF